MKTSDLARWLDIAPVTIRQWTQKEYREYLSPTAQGGSGRTRNFTDHDQRIIAHIARLKAGGMERDSIHAALKSLQSDEWRNLPEMPAAPPGFEPIAMIPTSTAETAVTHQRQALMREISLLQDQIEDLEADLKAERTAKEAVQAELSSAREQIGELRGELRRLEAERQPAEYWLKLVIILILGVIILGIVAAVLITMAGR